MDVPARFARPRPYRICGGTGGQQAPRQGHNLISRMLTQRHPLPGGCTPLERIAPNMRGREGRSISRWKMMERRAGAVFPSCPNRSSEGQQTPGRGAPIPHLLPETGGRMASSRPSC